MKFVIKICFLFLILSNILLSAKVDSEKSSLENKMSSRALAKRSSKSLTKNTSKLFSKLYPKSLQEQISKRIKDKFTHTSKKEYAMAGVSFVLEIIAQLDIPVISKYAKDALAVKQWGQACIDGLNFFLPILKGTNDAEYKAQKAYIENQYNTFLAEVKIIYVFYNGKDKDYDMIMKKNSVKEICLINKQKAEQADISRMGQDSQMLNKIGAIKSYGLTPLMTSNAKKDAKTTEEISNMWKIQNSIQKKLISRVNANIAYLNTTPEARKEKARKLFLTLEANKDLGSLVCDYTKDELNDFDRFICYTYFDLDYFQLSALQREQKSYKIIHEINQEFETLYIRSVKEAEVKLQIVKNMDCDLAKPVADQSNLTKILTAISKFIDLIKNGKSFIENCLLPPLVLAKETVDELNEKKKAEIEAQIAKAAAVEIANAAADKTPQQMLENLNLPENQDLNLNIDAAKAEITELQQQENLEEVNPDIEKIIKNNQLSEDFYDEDMRFELSKSNPSKFAEKNIEKLKEGGTKVKDMVKHVAKTFKDEAKKEAVAMIDDEIKEYKKNPLKYAKKISKESAKFALNPAKYATQTVIKVGAKVAVNTAFTLVGEAKDAVITTEYRNEHPYVSGVVDGAYKGLKMTKKDVTKLVQANGLKKSENLNYAPINKMGYAAIRGKNDNQSDRSRFKEISKRRYKALTKTKTKTLEKAITDNPFMAKRIKFYLQNNIKGIISNKLTERNFNKDLQENATLLKKIGGEIVNHFKPFVTSFACNNLVNLIKDWFGPGIFKYILMIQKIYDVIKGVYNALKSTDIVEKWSLFGRSIGKGIKMFINTDDNVGDVTILDVSKSLCGRKRLFKKFRKHMK